MPNARAGTTRRTPPALGYGLAVLTSLIALVISLLFGDFFQRSPFLLFFGAIALSAWYGGLGPGLLATVIATLGTLYYLMEPLHSLALLNPADMVRIGLFVGVASLVNLLSEARSHAAARVWVERVRLQVTLASIGDAVIATDALGRITFLNRVAEQLTGWPHGDALGRDLSAVFQIRNEETGAPAENPVAHVLREGTIVGLANHTCLVARDGSERPIDDSGAPIRDEDGAIVGVIVTFRDVTERRRAEAERERLLAQTEAARREAEAAGDRLTFLAEASEVLSSSLDYEATLASVARLAVPRVADWCGVDILREDGQVEQVAVAHVDPAKVTWAKEWRRRSPPDPSASTGLFQVLRTGRPQIYPEITDAMLAAGARTAEELAAARAVGFSSVILMPLVARNRVLGALSLVSAESGHLYSEDDVALAEELARRAATAIDNARLYHEVRDQRERFAVTLASIGDAVIATDTDGRVTFLNAVAQELTGWTPAAAAGQPIGEVFKIVNEETRAAVESPVSRVIRDGHVVGLANHTVLVAQDGQAHPIDDSGAPIRDEQGALRGVVLVFRDITARKEAERREQLLTEITAALGASLDLETTLDRVTHLIVPRVADTCLVDILADDGSIRRSALVAADPQHQQQLQEMQRRFPADVSGRGAHHVIATGEPVLVSPASSALLAGVAADEEHLALLQSFQATSFLVVPFDARGRMLGSLTLAMNISGRRLEPADVPWIREIARRAGLAIDNARLYSAAQAAVQVRDQFLSLASHELKTPLTSVLAAAQLLQRRTQRDGGLNPRDARSLQVLIEQATRLNRMVLSLLDLSRIESGQLSIERAPLDLVALLTRVVEEARLTFERHPLDLHLPDHHVILAGDALRLEQVIQNLIQNAVKYSPHQGPIQVRVDVAETEARLAVTDQGIGIPAAAIPQLFQRFYRAPNVETHHITGMGIGLFVVKEVITLHGGRVTVESREGAGSTFTVYLPLLDAGASVEAAREAPGAAPEA